VVVTRGLTDTDPPGTGVTPPTPLLIVAAVALVLVQFSVVEVPSTMEAGLADSELVGLG